MLGTGRSLPPLLLEPVPQRHHGVHPDLVAVCQLGHLLEAGVHPAGDGAAHAGQRDDLAGAGGGGLHGCRGACRGDCLQIGPADPAARPGAVHLGEVDAPFLRQLAHQRRGGRTARREGCGERRHVLFHVLGDDPAAGPGAAYDGEVDVGCRGDASGVRGGQQAVTDAVDGRGGGHPGLGERTRRRAGAGDGHRRSTRGLGGRARVPRWLLALRQQPPDESPGGHGGSRRDHRMEQPPASASTSTSTLSVASRSSASPSATGAPVGTSHSSIVPSCMVRPIFGSRTSTATSVTTFRAGSRQPWAMRARSGTYAFSRTGEKGTGEKGRRCAGPARRGSRRPRPGSGRRSPRRARRR